MKKRQLGTTNIMISELGFGCMSLPTDEQRATTLIDAALDGGITFFDTADLYDQGVNETLVGTALKRVRGDVVIATKVGNTFTPGVAGWGWNSSASYIKQAVHNSLRRLQTDYIDLYQLHGGTMDDDHDEVLDTFAALQKDGLIRAYGISSIRPNVIQRFTAKGPLTSVMMQYSLLDRRPEEWFLSLSRAGTSVIARGPLAKGLLATTCKTERLAKGYLTRTAEDIVTLRTALNEQFDSSLEALALRFALANDTVATIIPGASTVAQLQANVAAVQTSVTDEEIAALQQLATATVYTEHRA